MLCQWRAWIGITLLLFLVGCATQVTYAPVSDIASLEPIPASGRHRVQAGETLYEIAWRYGLDYRNLALYNNIPPPYTVFPGQQIILSAKTNKMVPSHRSILPDVTHSARWVWPAQGQIVKTFEQTQKGINIKGKFGEPIVATLAGTVVYAGSGLRGYGNLILIQHDDLYISAYGHNRRLSIKQGQTVKTGQKIAEMGYADTNMPILHFELRKAGKPVNPLNYIR